MSAAIARGTLKLRSRRGFARSGGRRHDMTTIDKGPIDEARLEAFGGQVVLDMGAAISGLLLHVGDRLGLYQAMAGAGPRTPAALAAPTGTPQRAVRGCVGD